MMDAKVVVDKIGEIEKRMDYVISNWKSDNTIHPQEIRFTILAFMYETYKSVKIRDLAKDYLQKIDEKRRLDSETILTAITCALIINQDFSAYWEKLKDIIDRSHGVEKYNLIM